MLNIFNSHYTGSNCWLYNSEKFCQMMNSFNVNIRVMFNVPDNTPCWLVEELAECRHPRQQIYLRFVKFVDCLAKNKKSGIKALFNAVVGDVRSLIGSNSAKIKRDTGVSVIPGRTRTDLLRKYKVYPVPEGHEWKLPLLISLLEIRSENFEVFFDEEGEEELDGNDIESMIAEIVGH